MSDQQPRVESVTWAPLYGPKEAAQRVVLWTGVGFVAAILTIIVATQLGHGNANRELAVFGIAAAIVVGVVLVAVGVGMLAGEALRAEVAGIGEGETKVLLDAAKGAVTPDDLAKIIEALKTAISGLSPARVLLFLGTILLVAGAAAAVVASGIIK